MSLSTTIGTVGVIGARDAQPRIAMSVWVDGIELHRALLPADLDASSLMYSGCLPAMSPDGKWLAMARILPGGARDGCYLMDAVTGAVTHHPEISGETRQSNRGLGGGPWWSADGRLVSADGRYVLRPGQSVVRTSVDIAVGDREAICPVPNCNGIVHLAYEYDAGADVTSNTLTLYSIETGGVEAQSSFVVRGDGTSSYANVEAVYPTGEQGLICVIARGLDHMFFEFGAGLVGTPLRGSRDWFPGYLIIDGAVVFPSYWWVSGGGNPNRVVSADTRRRAHVVAPAVGSLAPTTGTYAAYSGYMFVMPQSIYEAPPTPRKLISPTTLLETERLAPLFVRSLAPWAAKTVGVVSYVGPVVACSPSFVAYSPPGTFWQNMRYAGEVMV